MLGKLKVEEGDDRWQLDGITDSYGQIWVEVNSESWQWTGKPSVLLSMGSQRVRQDWVTELNWTELMCSVSQLCPTLLQPTRWIAAHQVDCSPPGSSVHGIFQARILEWVAISFSKGSSWSRDWTHTFCVSCIAGRFFTTEPLGKPYVFPFYPSNVAVPKLDALAPFFFKIYLFLIGG